jgi:V-type H+-transporting ATPase subunit H
VKIAPEENLSAMVVAKLLQFIKALSSRKWTDQEITEDLSFLQDELQASFDKLTYYLIISTQDLLLVHLTSILQN